MAGASFLSGLAILAVLVIALTHLSVWLGSRESEKEQDGRHRGKRRRHQAISERSGANAIAYSLDSINDELYASGKQNRHHERTRTTLEVSAVVAATAAAGFAFWSAWIFRGQLAQMQADNRPWIEVSVEPASLRWLPEKLRRDAIGWADMSPRITVKNVGKSPAFAVQAGAWGFIPSNANNDVLAARRRVCGYLTNGKVPRGKIFFPGESATPTHDGFGIRGFGLDKTDIERGAAENVGRFRLFVIGCADYMFGGHSTHHQTYFWFEVVRKVPMNGSFGIDGTFQVGENIPADQLIFMPLESGNDAN